MVLRILMCITVTLNSSLLTDRLYQKVLLEHGGERVLGRLEYYYSEFRGTGDGRDDPHTIKAL